MIQKQLSAACIRSIPIIVLLSLNQAACSSGSLIASDTNADNVTLTSISSPLSDNAFRATISLPYSAPASLKPGQEEAIHFVVKNAGDSLWPSAGQSDGKYQIRLGNRWFDGNHEAIVADDGRSALPYDIEPGREAELLLIIKAPKIAGQYILVVDMVQEQVAWFGQKGSKTLELKLAVE